MQPLKAFKKLTFIDNRLWTVYVEVFKTVKHVYIKPYGYEFFTFDFVLKGREYNQDVMYHAITAIKGL